MNMNKNSYEVDLPDEYEISSILNMFCMYRYSSNNKELKEVIED